MIRHHHSLIQEATDAGYRGATAVFLWFLLWDTIAGQPLQTPNLLGQLLIFRQASPTSSCSTFSGSQLWGSFTWRSGNHLSSTLCSSGL